MPENFCERLSASRALLLYKQATDEAGVRTLCSRLCRRGGQSCPWLPTSHCVHHGPQGQPHWGHRREGGVWTGDGREEGVSGGVRQGHPCGTCRDHRVERGDLGHTLKGAQTPGKASIPGQETNLSFLLVGHRDQRLC